MGLNPDRYSTTVSDNILLSLGVNNYVRGVIVRITTAAVAVLMCTTSMFAQVVNRSPQDRDRDPCPGGGASVELEPVGGRPGLDQLIAMSELVIVGTVNNVLPAFNPNPNDKRTVETDALVAIDQILYGQLPTGVRTILLYQLGGSTATCTMVVPADPEKGTFCS